MKGEVTRYRVNQRGGVITETRMHGDVQQLDRTGAHVGLCFTFVPSCGCSERCVGERLLMQGADVILSASFTQLEGFVRPLDMPEVVKAEDDEAVWTREQWRFTP